MDRWIAGLLDRFRDGVLICARDRRVRYANRALLRTAGTTLEDASALDAIDWLSQSLRLTAESASTLARAVDDVGCDLRDGFEVEIDASPSREHMRLGVHGMRVEISDETLGEPAMLLQLWDMTSHWQIAQTLSDRFHLLQTIIDAIPSPIFYKDRAGVYRGCNKAFERYIGIAAERVIGGTVYDVSPKDLADKYSEMDRALIEARGVQVYEHGVRYADGTVHDVVFHKATYGDREGEAQGLVGVMLDVTERKRAEEEARKAADAMQAAMRLKSRFLAVVSHEIRTPLNGVLGMIELLARTDLETEQRRLLDVARDSAEHLLHLLNNVLDFSRLEADRVELESRDFALHDVVRVAIEAMLPTARAKGIELACTIADDVPRAVHGDPSRLRQLLWNLISNAVKFTERGGVRVEVTTLDSAARVRFGIRDTGVGIPFEARERLFTDFVQASESIARKYGGTGLGLAIAKRLAEHMGGTIEFASELGKGTTFWLTIPLARAQAALRTEAHGDRAAALTASDHSLRVLVVEDNYVNQLVAIGMLRALGHEARVAPNGAAAVELLSRSHESFELVLMDLEMPEMDGLAAARAIRALPAYAHVPIVAVTAHVTEAAPRQCAEAGMDAFVTKPFGVDQLASVIASVFLPKSLRSIAPSSSHMHIDEAAPLDLERVDVLEREIGRDAVRRVHGEFLAALPDYVDHLSRAVVERREGGFVYAHALKGAAEQVGASALGALARRWETALRSGELATLSLEELRASADAARVAVERRWS